MNTEQKKRIAHEISNWKNACNCRAVQLTGDRMAALLQELVNTSEPDGSSSLIYHGDGTCTLKPGFKAVAYGGDTSANLIGLPPVGELQIDAAPAHAELPTWENGDDPLVGGGLISRGKVDFTALGIWPSKPAPDAEPVAYVTGYYAGYLSIATIDGRVLPAGTALFTAPPAPSVPDVATATNPSQISSSAEPFGYFKAEPFGWTDCAETDDGAIALYTAPPAPSVPPVRSTGQWESSRIADYNRGWNACREAMLAATPTQPEPPADVARDAERLDWLLRNLPGDALRYCVGVLSDTSDGKEFREAIDAAIERQGGE